MSEGLFTTIGDEPVEARIVAWVLGEASAFEAAELERLCDERPELMIFKRRMVALNGLLQEASPPHADIGWKLPPAKRSAIVDLLDPAPAVTDTYRERRVRHSAKRTFLTIAACVIFTVIVLGLAAPMTIRQRKKSDVAVARSMAIQRELAALEMDDRMQPLRTDLPSELIEGTPKPINVPNLEVPTDGPAGSGSWSVNEESQLAHKPSARPETPERPSAPASSVAKVVTAGTLDRIAVPVPEVEVTTPSLDFGNADEFGAGWGEGKDKEKLVGGMEIVGGAKLELQSGLRSGDGAVSRNNIDAILNRPGLPGEAAGAAGAKNMRATEEIPVLGSLFADRENRVVTEEVRYKIDESDRRPAPSGEPNTAADKTVNDYWDTSEAVAKGKATGTEYELQTGYKSEYLFRGRNLNGEADEAVTEALELRKAGKYDEARSTLEGVLSRAPGNQAAGDELAKLDDPLRTNPALTYEHTQNVDAVRRGLYVAEGNYNLGKFDDAKREYEDVLRKDPYNQAARRGVERIEAAKSDYYRAAYDHTRSELLSQVGNAWELSVPAEGIEIDGFINYGAPIGKDVAALPDDAEALAKAVREQEDKVEERRKVLATIVRNKGIVYNGQDSFYNQGGVDEDLGARSVLQTYHQVEQDKLQLQSQVSSLLKYDNDQLMIYAGGLDLPDNIIRELYPKYQVAKRQLDELMAKGLADRHPDVQGSVEQVENMKRQLDEGVVNLRATLQARLDQATNRLKSVELMKNETREEAIKRGLDAQDYADAKKEFEKDQQLLQQMKLKMIAASMKAKAEAPKPDLTELMEEIAASEEPYSTFSLNISDASFRIAQAAMDKGERPDSAGIKVEQFYNAVDYGDPAPAAGEPVSCTIEQAAHPVIPGRNLVRVALKTAAAGRSATQPLHLTLLVDQSGSMTRADRRAAMDTAMASLGKLLTDKDLVNIVGFSRTSRLVADGMKGDEAGRKLAELVNQSASEGGTNLETAIDLAAQMAQRRMLAGAQNRIVLFTDGAANLGDADPQRLAAKVGQLRQQGIAFDIAGIAADGLNDELLGELARKGNGRYYVVGKGAEDDFAKQLAGAFRPAAENVKVQVRFNPERVTRYKLIGFEKDRLKTEDFRNDAVDAAELAAEEAGVAIYQIEPNPNGSGEIGEVSVRFRDTASGEMVERGWTIPHDGATPAIDRATASIQLAVLSMFAAEKLKGGPLGEAIDFKQLAEAQANVKHFFGNDARVAEMLRMVEMLK